MREDPRIDPADLAEYAAGTCSAAERVRIDAMLSADPDSRAQMVAMTRVRAGLQQSGADEITPVATRIEQQLAAWVRAEGGISRASGKFKQWEGRTRVSSSWGRGVVALGSALAVAFVVGAALLLPDAWRSRADAFQPRAYATKIGEQATFTLDDGTRVTLAPHTTFRVMALGERARTVVLDGEAYFEVARATGAPFIVQTGRISTRVLGTAFLVQHYATDPYVRVAVTTGKVVVQAHTLQQPNITLVAGSVGEVTDSSATTTAMGDVSQYGSWRQGRLVFRDAPISEVLTTLGRWYGYRFRFSDSTLVHESVTAVLSTESATAFSTLKLLLDIDFRFDGDIVTVVRQQSSRARVRHTPQELLPTHTNEVGR